MIFLPSGGQDKAARTVALSKYRTILDDIGYFFWTPTLGPSFLPLYIVALWTNLSMRSSISWNIDCQKSQPRFNQLGRSEAALGLFLFVGWCSPILLHHEIDPSQASYKPTYPVQGPTLHMVDIPLYPHDVPIILHILLVLQCVTCAMLKCWIICTYWGMVINPLRRFHMQFFFPLDYHGTFRCSKIIPHSSQLIVAFSQMISWYPYLVGGLEHVLFSHINWVSNHPNCLSYFSEGWPNRQPAITSPYFPPNYHRCWMVF